MAGPVFLGSVKVWDAARLHSSPGLILGSHGRDCAWKEY